MRDVSPYREAAKLVSYTPETGVIINKKGVEIGYQLSNGYRYVNLLKKQLLIHKLGWFMHYGGFPGKRIRHLNGDKADNRISNLAEMDRKELTPERAKQLFEYRKGKLYRKFSVPGQKFCPNIPAGTLMATGYRFIHADGRGYLVHRIIWLMFNGKLPNDELDHINGDRTDNRIKNLREADRTTNCRDFHPNHGR
jgi:hypothetical protein